MNIEIKNIYNNSVLGEDEVCITVSEQEAKNLKSALDLIEKYKKIGVETYKDRYKQEPEHADFCSYNYRVEDNKVFVIIQNGAVG